MRVDAHQHFWSLARGDYRWLTPALKKIYRDFLPDDLRPLIAKQGVTHTVLVQAADTVDETRYMLELAKQHDFIAGVVGWIDFDKKNAPDVIADLSRDRKLRGLRPMIQDIPDDGWMLRPELGPALKSVQALDLRFDALVLPKHLKALHTLLLRHPDLEVVIDHGGKPAIKDKGFQPWANDIARIARDTRALCKVSGLVTEASADWKPMDLRNYVNHLMQSFGPSRLIWGSDWPVVNLAADYEKWIVTAEQLFSGLPQNELDAIFGKNARKFYRLAIG